MDGYKSRDFPEKTSQQIQTCYWFEQSEIWQLTVNYRHWLTLVERHSSKKNTSPARIQAELCKPLFSFNTHRSVAGIPAPFPLIHASAYAGARKRARKNFFMEKKKIAAPFLRRGCQGPAGLTTDGSESHPRASLWSCPLKHAIRIPHIPPGPTAWCRAAPRHPARLSSRYRGDGMWAEGLHPVLPPPLPFTVSVLISTVTI